MVCQKTYDSFLSYSSRDAVAVARIHRILEDYRPPRGVRVARQRLHIFRYQEDQTVSDSLTDDLKRRVCEVDTLIFAASKSAVASEKVEFELLSFASARGISRLFIVVVADTFEAGVPEKVLAQLRDPIWVDARGSAGHWFGWTTGGRRRTQGQLLPLIAALFEAEPDFLIARDRKRRNMWRGAVAGSMLAIFSAFAAIVFRTPDEAWMSTEVDRIGRPIESASIVHGPGEDSIRAFSQWTERLSDDALGRYMIMELDFDGHQTGIVGVAYQAEGAWVETKHTGAFGSHGTLARDLEKITTGKPNYRTFTTSGIKASLLRTPLSNPPDLLEDVIQKSATALMALGYRAPSPSFSRCFVSNPNSICFLDFAEADSAIPVRYRLDTGQLAIGVPIRDAGGADSEYFAHNSNFYYVTMSIGDDESGYSNLLLRSRNALEWERTEFDPGDRRLKFTGIVTASEAQRGLAIAMSSVEFGPMSSIRPHIFLSTDDAVSWEELNAGIPHEGSATLVGINGDGRLAALFADANLMGGTICIWRPLSLLERIDGTYGVKR